MKWIWIVSLTMLISCGESPVEQELDTETIPGPHQVDYHVSWDTSGVAFSDAGLELTNNLGYDIELTGGYLVFYSTQLVACADEESSELVEATSPSIDWGKWWGRLIGIRTAYAGHGDEDLDSSVMAQSYIENLVEPQSIELGSRTIEGTR